MTYAEIGDNLSRHFHVLVEYKKTAIDGKFARRADVLMYSLNHYYGDDGVHDMSNKGIRYGEDIACSLDSISAHDELHKMPEACQFTLEKAIKKLVYYRQNRYTYACCSVLFTLLRCIFCSWLRCRIFKLSNPYLVSLLILSLLYISHFCLLSLISCLCY